MELKDLAGHSAALAPVLGITSAQLNLMLEFLGKKKIAKPDVEFKASVPNMAKPGKKPFLFVEEEKGSFFFYNCDFRMQKKDIEPQLKKAEKALKSAKDGEKELLEAQVTFLTLCLDRIKKKKWLATSGKVAYKNTNSETSECFMSLEGKVEGPRKSSMDAVLAELDFKDKNGNILRIQTGTSDTDTGTDTVQDTATEEETTTRSTPNPKHQRQVEQLIQGLAKIKAVIGSVAPQKLTQKVEHIQGLLDNIIEEAEADGQLDDTEKADFDRIQAAIDSTLEAISEGGQGGTTLTPEMRNKMQDNMKKLTARLEKTIADLNAL
jgi:hypothetical protein